MKKGLIALFLGLACIATGFLTRRAMILCTEKVTATVVDHNYSTETTDGEFRSLYEPIIEYTYNGNTYTGRMSSGEFYDSIYPVGSAVEIKINPNDPNMMLVINNNFLDNYAHFVFIGFGILVSIIGIVKVVRRD